MSQIILQFGDVIDIKNKGVRFISKETNKWSISLEDANFLLEKGDILAIQVIVDGEEYFMSISEIENKVEYIIYDKQLGLVVREGLSLEGVRKFAFEIVTDRSEAEFDELGEQFQQLVKDGFENFLIENAIEIIKDWLYEVRKNIA